MDEGSVPSPSSPGSLLFSHLQIRAASARSIVLAPPRTVAAPPFLRDLSVAYRTVDPEVRRIDLTQELTRPASREEIVALLAGQHICIAWTGGLLDDGNALLAASAADAVVVLAMQGRTSRVDLESARGELERGGARLIGAVLIA